MVDREPRRGLKARAEQIAVKASGLSYFGVAGVGVNRLVSGGSIGVAVAEVGLGVIAGVQLTGRERLKTLSSEKIKDAIGLASIPSILGMYAVGGHNFSTLAGKYEVATTAFLATSAVIFHGKEVSRREISPAVSSESASK